MDDKPLDPDARSDAPAGERKGGRKARPEARSLEAPEDPERSGARRRPRERQADAPRRLSDNELEALRARLKRKFH